MKRILSFFALSLFLFTMSACDSTEPDDPHAGEEELITRVVLTLTGGGQTVTATADDPDGDGVGIQTETIVLQNGVTYTGSIALFNDLADEPEEENVTAEIEDEDDEHQFFYTVGGSVQNGVTVTITDQDGNGLPVGLDYTVAVANGSTGTGTLNVVLSHYDDGPKNGTDRSDETDIDVTFPLTVQ